MEYTLIIKKELGIDISHQSISNILKENKIFCYTKKNKPLLTKIQKKKRFNFCQKYLLWTDDDWGKVLFTDESPFKLFSKEGKTFCYRKKNEGFQKKNLSFTKKFGQKINIWASMSYNGTGSIVLIKGNMEKVQYL